MGGRTPIRSLGLSNYAEIGDWRDNFSMVFGAEEVVPAEITHFDPRANEDLMITDSTFAEERHDNAKSRYDMYKNRI